MSEHLVKSSLAQNVLTVTMDNPATGNAMDQDLGPQLVAALESAATLPGVGAVVLTGSGGVFSAGGNLKRAWQHLSANPSAGAGVVFESYTKWVSRAVTAICLSPAPVVAAVVGAASGAGLAWMAAADLAVVAEDSKIIPGFTGVGLVPAAGITMTLSRLLGPALANQVLMGNRPIPPARALEMGLAHQVLPADQVLPAARELAARLAAGPRKANAASKKLMAASALCGLAGQLEEERRAVMVAADLPEFRDRVAAFFQRK